MGIVEEKLAEFEIDGKEYVIEYNHHGAVHLHTENLRIDLSPRELYQLSETLQDAQDELSEIKG